MSKRKFKWHSWNFDGDGESYVIAQDECPNRADVPRFIAEQDELSPECITPQEDTSKYLKTEDVQAAWCKWQVRTDWEGNDDNKPMGWYVVETHEPLTKDLYGKRKPGWFAVWVVRKGVWY